jgi:hypothetical protein
VLDTILGRFFIKVTLQDLKIQVKWDLVFVYGAVQEEDKEMFLFNWLLFATIKKILR